MDKAQIKKFSQYARSTLIPEMEQAISIWKNANIVQWWVQIWNHSYNDSLSLKYSSAVTSLKKQIEKKWEKALAEEAAYIWFNRIVALRFMEVNRYLPTRSSLFVSDDDTWIPEIVKNIDSERNNCWCDKNAIDQYIWKYDTQSIQELYGLILVSICNKLSEYYWFMFSKIDDWTALLFPRTILNASHILRDKNNGMLNIVDEDRKEVEIIWWIYQYYISERKAELDSSNEKLQNSEEIAASTQLFTPEWIVKYIVHNTIGKLDSKDELLLTHKIKTENNFDYDVSDLSKFKVLDPASWSGHILVRAYDVLKEVYLQRWHDIDDIPAMILKDNLYWFDIDERAHQLACFAILMKAKADDKNIEKKVDITKNIICIKENNKFEDVDEKRYPHVRSFLKIWYNASMYGSLIRIPSDIDIEKTEEEFEKFQKENWLVADSICTQNEFEVLLHQTELLDDLYDCVVANPPYKGWGKLDLNYWKFLANNYPKEKYDLFCAFITRCLELVKVWWLFWSVTMHARMFLSSYEDFRKQLCDCYLIDSLIHHWTRWFPEISWEVVQTCSFIIKNSIQNNKNWTFVDLRNYKSAEEKENWLKNIVKNINSEKVFYKSKNDLSKIPWCPIAYWVTENFIKTFNKENKRIEEYWEAKSWIMTWNDNRFLRLWFEVNKKKIGFNCKKEDYLNSKYDWYTLNKWWTYRKRYWNLEYIVYLSKQWEAITNSWWNYRLRDDFYYFKSWFTRSEVTTWKISFRYSDNWSLFWSTWPMVFIDFDNKFGPYLLWILNSNIAHYIFNIINPTIHYNVACVSSLPIIIDESLLTDINWLVINSVNISKQDRDSFETSWDFKEHPLIEFKWNNDLILNCFAEWHNKCVERAQNIKNNEEELNKIFNKIYWLEWEIDPTVSDDDITIRKADRTKDIKSLLSYIIWCVMWRYSLDQEWLVYAWWEFDKSKYTKFKADDDGIIPILDNVYSDDDIVERTEEFIEKVRWKETLNENLNWIAETFEKSASKTSKQIIREYYQKWFYEDHVKTYQKRPIYWLFVSNPNDRKKSAFKALVYMHRIDGTTIQELRRKYVQDYQSKLHEELARIENDNTKQKRVDEIHKISAELTDYANRLKDFAINNPWTIDLDDWVKVNYAKFAKAWLVADIL